MNHMINLILLLLISYLYFLFFLLKSSNEPNDANNPQISDVFASSSEPVSGNGSLLSLASFLLEALVPFLGELGGTTLLLEPDSESLFESLSESLSDPVSLVESESESLDESESLPESESLAESESLSES
ncbi:hypothetical protein U530_02691, partial [Staphylococcus aureus F77974]